jgi:hypothetical protein
MTVKNSISFMRQGGDWPACDCSCLWQDFLCIDSVLANRTINEMLTFKIKHDPPHMQALRQEIRL